MAEFLLAHGTMSRDQFEACMEGRAIPEQASSTLFDRAPAAQETEQPEENA